MHIRLELICFVHQGHASPRFPACAEIDMARATRTESLNMLSEGARRTRGNSRERADGPFLESPVYLLYTLSIRPSRSCAPLEQTKPVTFMGTRMLDKALGRACSFP